MTRLVKFCLNFYEKSPIYESYREQEKLIEKVFSENKNKDDLKALLIKACVLIAFILRICKNTACIRS